MKVHRAVAGAIWPLIAALAAAPALAGHEGKPVTIEERAQGSDRVVVGKVSRSRAEYMRNEHGDDLIVTRHQVQVSETLKGASQDAVEVLIEGGTVGDTTLEVSDL